MHKIFTTALSMDQMQDVRILNKHRRAVWLEFKLTRTLIDKGHLDGNPYPYLVSGRSNGGVINTLHAAATALDEWFEQNKGCWETSAVMSTQRLLNDIKRKANALAVVTDSYEGEDDSQHSVRDWIQLMVLFGVSVRESRILRMGGHLTRPPDFMLFPPRKLVIN